MTDPMRWRPMTPDDLAGVQRAADLVHLSHPEDLQIFAERLDLFPAGCAILANEAGVGGYLISHPWFYGAPPALNAKLGQIPADADTYYIHDIALLAQARRRGYAPLAIAHAKDRAMDLSLSNVTLVAVNNSSPFWRRLGFEDVSPPGMGEKLRSYGSDARFMKLDIA